MPDIHGSETRLFLNGVDLSNQFRESEAGRKRELVDTTGYGAAGTTHIASPVGMGMVMADGMLDVHPTTGVRVIQDAIEAAGDNLAGDDILTYALRDTTLGDPAFLVVGSVHDNKVTSVLKDVAKTSFAAQGNRSLWGNALHPRAARTAAHTAVGLDHGASSAFGGVGVLQVLALSGTAPVLAAKLQHSSDSTNGVDGVWVDLGTPFAAINAASVASGYADHEVVAGTVNRWTRIVLSITSGTLTSVTFAAHFGRYTAIR